MRLQRTKNAQRNIVFGLIQKLYQIIMPFIMRTIMIYSMGIEYAGLNNLFASILQVLNLAELGIGAALICSMYGPIAEDNVEKICALMNVYKKVFRIIGLAILLVGLILLPILPELIAGDIPDSLNLYVLYLMYLGNTVLSYWLFAYKNSLFYAHQRMDITSKVIICTNTVQYILQVFVLIILHNYYFYLLSSIITQIMTNILTAICADRMYPQYKPKGKLDKATIQDIKKKVRGLITNKFGSTLLKSADSIVISAFLGLSVLAVYQNYLDFKTMTFVISWISTICCSCFMGLFQPFMKIWMGEKYLLNYPTIICLIVYFYIYEIDQMIGTYKDAAGIWYEDRYRPLITALVNLVLNLVFVQFIGLYGVLLSTVISLLFLGIPWMIYNIFNLLFKGESKLFYSLSLLKYALAAIVSVTLSFWTSDLVPDKKIYTLPLKLLICVICPIVFYLIVFYKNPYLKRGITIGKRMIHRKLKNER